jgi:hypothetical protein
LELGKDSGLGPPEGFDRLLSAEMGIRSVTEEAIGSLDEAASMIGRIHRIALMEEVLPSPTQLNYLHKSWREIGLVISYLSDALLKTDALSKGEYPE